MNHSETVGKLAEALSKAQGVFGHVEKDGKSHHGKYATLAAVLETVRGGLADNGLSIVQAPGTEGNTVTVTTRIMHSSGEWLETTVSAPAATDIQKLGSSISYLRRYSLMAVLSLAADDDDDGNAAMKGPQKAQRPAPRPSAPPAPAPADSEPLGKEAGARLHAQLGAMLKGTDVEPLTHVDFVAQVIGREVAGLSELTRAESKIVYSAAKQKSEAA
ncbi:ERF family protein [Deinococcus humi]|uniref:Uncharacterized protein n=1 Tax=Deinococcus humi TaxID=662880 RepID=A0A7W8JQL1_9DEIO|nr:ERF family protein [Deinococcus humi]MBB5361372.1 hypothetical protein [Deinococcus humi]GGO19734.1 hypothetical protein GCM10008949_04340 [Deinococcus humi]